MHASSPHAASNAARKIRLLMQLRRQGITDTRVLSALERVPREAFVPVLFQDQAYVDKALPIGHGQTLSQPLVVAMMSQALACRPEHRVLEIGTGSGYQAAVLAHLAAQVYSIERYRELSAAAAERLAGLGLKNLHLRIGDGMAGWPEEAPFDRIMVTAAAVEVPQQLAQQLAEGGSMVLPLGPHQGEQELLRLTRKSGKLYRERLGPVRFVPLLPGIPGHREA